MASPHITDEDLELLALDRLHEEPPAPAEPEQFVFSHSSRLDYGFRASGAFSRLRFLRLRLRANADLRRFFWPGFK